MIYSDSWSRFETMIDKEKESWFIVTEFLFDSDL